jgi:hypothetical protein
MVSQSPYKGASPDRWAAITDKVVASYPLKSNEIVDIVFEAWRTIFTSAIGTHGVKMGKDIFPKPQIMGALLHELIDAVVPVVWTATGQE